MRFVVVRSLDGDCEPTCPEWIMADGSIDAKAPARLKALLKLTVGRRLPLLVTSGGGDSDAAMALGRLIRKGRLDVLIARTKLDGCGIGLTECEAKADKPAGPLGKAASTGAVCMAECALVLAGGVRRMAGSATVVGRIARSTGGKAGRRVTAYLTEMGVDQALLDRMPPGSVDTAMQRALHKARLLTSYFSIDPVDLIVSGSVCKATPAPDNCRVFTVDDVED